jgi:UDP-glucose 4-epimerase
MAQKALVFGASGFIASYLIDELLARGFTVTASDISDEGRDYWHQRDVRFVLLDITKSGDFKQLDAEYDIVVHLAACQPANVSAKEHNPREYIEVNVLGTINILEFCVASRVGKLIYACSHRNTEGLWSNEKCIAEDDGIAIKYTGEYSMFSISETAAQDCVLHYQATHNLRALIFRLPPVYGFGPHTEIFKNGIPLKTGFQVFIEKARKKEPLEVWGDATVGRDIIYVKDVVSAFLKAVEKPDTVGLFNITSGIPLTLGEQAEAIAKNFWGDDSEPKVIYKPELSNGIVPFCYDNKKAQRELGWKPFYSFEQMLTDYKIEEKSGRYKYLVDKRKKMLK